MLVKVHCGPTLQGAKVEVYLTSPEGRMSDVLSLGPCPADQNAEFTLSNYKDLKTVSVFARATKDNQTIKEFSRTTVDVAPSCSAIDIDLDVGGDSTAKDAGDANIPDGGSNGPPACVVGTEGCSCLADSKCSGDFVCTLGQCRTGNCGDGKVNANEECDDGNLINTDACTSTCRNAQCGDGFVQTGEGCDDGPNPKVELDACAPDCSWRYEKKYIYPTTAFFGGSPTAGTYNGNLGGPAGADAICQKLAGPLRPLSQWKAMIVGGNRRAAATPYDSSMAQDWVIRKYTYYYNETKELVWRTDGTRLLGVRNGAPSNLLAEVINTYPWGGWLDDWTTQPTTGSQGTCKGWTSASDADWGTFPLTSLLKGAGEPCYTNMPLLCVEQ